MKCYDICTNISNRKFDKVRDDVIAKAQQAGVQIIASGTDGYSVDWNNRNAERYDILYTAGLHPHYAKHWDDNHRSQIKYNLKRERCVLAGETGLDYFRNLSTAAEQEKSFRAQLELALEFDKPILLHDRDAHKDFLRILDNYIPSGLRGVVHCCTSPKEITQEYINRGLYVGFTGWITDQRRNEASLKALKVVPTDKLLIETDAPYLTPWTNGKHPGRVLNVPENVFYVAQFIAQELDLNVDDLLRATKENTEALLQRK